VAVVIPTYDHAKFLSEALRSTLAQTHRADEIIVVDDGSNDAPEAVVRIFPSVRFIRRENGGLSAAATQASRPALPIRSSSSTQMTCCTPAPSRPA